MLYTETALHFSFNYTPDGAIDYGDSVAFSHPKYPPFDFEHVDFLPVFQFINRNPYYPIYVAFIYLPLIFGIQHLMKNRRAFDLKRELFFWNAAIGIFSIIGLIRSAPFFFEIFLQPGGLFNSLCLMRPGSFQSGFWGLAFTFSKYVELGDTVFIVLRKKPLLFIQWYHHWITLSVAWITTPYAEPTIRFLAILNYTIHSIMYPYFAAKSLDLKVPRQVAKTITTLQLVQMFIGMFVNIYTAYMFMTGTGCYRHPISILSYAVLFGSFIILFGKLFYESVIIKKSKVQ